ncbi:hypothetical protein WN944_026201 [Citrus x changshan-huyou]|uniref:Uncharacterized protein n=1 Tax=Citrus x changshan-huyou TaxID=2935761 RepID=A0AAP0QHE4_9ROSI
MKSPFEGVEISVGANNGRRTMKISPLSDKLTQKNGNEEQIRKKITKQPKTCIPPDHVKAGNSGVSKTTVWFCTCLGKFCYKGDKSLRSLGFKWDHCDPSSLSWELS